MKLPFVAFVPDVMEQAAFVMMPELRLEIVQD
jgi:hypothetical protein